MIKTAIVSCVLSLFMQLQTQSDPISASMPPSIQSLIDNGQYSKAAAELELEASQSKNKDLRNFYLWEAERIRRIIVDYSLTKEVLFEQLQKRLNGVDEPLFSRWLQENRFDSRIIDGELRFVSPSVSNLVFRYPDVQNHLKEPPKHRLGRYLADLSNSFYNPEPSNNHFLSPRRFHIRMKVTIEAGTVPEGKIIRCWIPFPQECAFQKDVTLVSASPQAVSVNPPGTPHRAVYLEQPSKGNDPVEFSIEYKYSSYPRIQQIRPEDVTPKIPREAEKYLQEEYPHIVFLPSIREKVAEIVGNTENPYEKAQKIYQWMCENFCYSYAREYSTLRNISEYSFSKKYGDCGQLALTFITMCRIAGIPARWESGWMLYPVLANLHDWCVIYLDPYGWVPVDVNMGIESHHTWAGFPTNEVENISNFYLGHIDPFRLVVNESHGADFIPAKNHFRSDTVDFQRGELEFEDGNIYYNRFDYSLEVLSSDVIEG